MQGPVGAGPQGPVPGAVEQEESHCLFSHSFGCKVSVVRNIHENTASGDCTL